MNLTTLLSLVKTTARKNAPAILTAVGVSGTFTTAYLAAVASWRAKGRLSEGPPIEDLTKREIFDQVWDLYLPPVISGVVTVGCILGANHVSSHRATAAYSLLATSERALEEYRNKVVEQIGERKEKALRDEIAQDRVSQTPPTLVLGSGNVLCCELFTGRYFNSDIEALRKAQNDINARLFNEPCVPLNYFYHLVGLPETSASGDVGWEMGNLMELDFSTVMSDDSRPCIAFAYNYVKPI